MQHRRKNQSESTSGGLSADYRYPSEFIEEIESSREGLDSSAATQLRMNREDGVLRDARFRRKHVKFDHAEELVDKKSTETNEEGIPARNRIRRIVEDLLSTVIPNVPSASLRADAPLDTRSMSEEEARLASEYRRETENIANKAVDGILSRSELGSKKDKIIYDAVVDGVGYAHPRMETLASRRRQRRLSSLLMKENWGPKELDEFSRLTKQPTTGHVEAREIFWREGVRSVDDEQMSRVSRVRDVDLQWLRDYYDDPDIQPGRSEDSLYLDNFEEQVDSDQARAGYAETWEIEEFVAQRSSKFIMDPSLTQAEAEWSVQYKDAIMVYTAITTNKLLEYRIFTGDEMPMELPFVPFYIKTSKRHPYGFSVPLMLELQQRFANRMLAVIAEQAMNSVSPTAFAAFLEALGAGDRQEIERAVKEGGIAWLEGNDSQDIREMIQDFPVRNSGPNNAIANVMRSEEQAMMREGQALSPSMLSGARSAAGKQAIQNAADRPKQYSILNISDAVETHYERLYELLQRAVGEEEMLLPVPGGESVTANQEEKRPVVETTYSGRPMTMDSMKSKRNPAGLVYRNKTFKKGDLTVPMEAQADSRGMWPTGLRAKLRLASAMAEAGVLTSQKTVRELVLDERTRLKDDRNRREEDQMQQKLQKAMQNASGAGQASNVRGSQNPDLAGVEQTGMQQSVPGGGAGAPEEQVGQKRRVPEEEQADVEQRV